MLFYSYQFKKSTFFQFKQKWKPACAKKCGIIQIPWISYGEYHIIYGQIISWGIEQGIFFIYISLSSGSSFPLPVPEIERQNGKRWPLTSGSAVSAGGSSSGSSRRWKVCPTWWRTLARTFGAAWWSTWRCTPKMTFGSCSPARWRWVCKTTIKNGAEPLRYGAFSCF